ncbi:MAG: CRISPR-associated endonuclease Cas2 [Hydrogenophilales bacterium]|nr:CRISPR-associated endonuclease Cas2 [Hydrogenophilales bacterium]
MSRVWVVCYDIADNRRRGLVADLLEGHGVRVQESVFEIILDMRGLARLRDELRALCDWSEDSLRYYPLCQHCHVDSSWQGRGGEKPLTGYFLV